jgi:cytochrome P450
VRFADHVNGEVHRSGMSTPTISGAWATQDLLRRGLRTDGPLIRGIPGSDIARVRFGRRTTYVLKHPDYVDHVLHDGADRYHKSIEYELLRTVTGLSLFTDEDESWRRHRMLLNPVMAKRHVRSMADLMIGPIERYAGRIDDGKPEVAIEMSGAMTELTMDVVGAALFGHQFGEMSRRMRRVVTAGLRGAEIATRVLVVAGPPVWGVRAAAAAIHHSPLLPRSLAHMQWVMKSVDEAVWEVIHDRRAHPTEADDLLNLLLSARDERGEGLPLKRIRDEATTFMLAGHETTANALAWTWYLLAQNPGARARMLAEVDDVLGGRRPTVDDVPRLEWTSACVQEAMRVYPPAWIIPRTAIAPDVIDGHRIRKGATVMIPIHAIHHDERWWPEPEIYDPERFTGDNARGRHRSAYLPFGGGRRICIGTSFALMEMALIVAMLSQRFVFDLDPGHRVEPEATLTLRPRRGVKMIATRRPPLATAQEAA